MWASFSPTKKLPTPMGARVFGRAGVDGIHFCRIDGFGDTVFAVSPMNDPDDCVHPIAESFEDFLRLLLACGDTAPLEQAHQWERSRFDRFVAKNPPSSEGQAALDAIAALDLTPMPEPWAYLHRLEEAFDFSACALGRLTGKLWPHSPPKYPLMTVGLSASATPSIAAVTGAESAPAKRLR